MVRNWHSPLHPKAGDPIRWVIGGPTRRLSPWAQLVKHDLERARRLDMVEAYFSTGRGRLKRIARAARRKGTRLVQPPRSANGPPAPAPPQLGAGSRRNRGCTSE